MNKIELHVYQLYIHGNINILQVTYDANGFLERNRDNLNQDLVSCLLNSNNEFIRDLFSASMSATGSIAEYVHYKFSLRACKPLI
jgi:hypothetical protein